LIWYAEVMGTILKTKNISLTEAMRLYIEEKISQRVERVVGKQSASEVVLAIEVGRSTLHHRKGAVWEAKATLQWGKELLRAETAGENFQEVVDFLEEELIREVKKYKGKENTQERRGARRAKKNATIAKAARFYRKGRIREEGK